MRSRAFLRGPPACPSSPRAEGVAGTEGAGTAADSGTCWGALHTLRAADLDLRTVLSTEETLTILFLKQEQFFLLFFSHGPNHTMWNMYVSLDRCAILCTHSCTSFSLNEYFSPHQTKLFRYSYTFRSDQHSNQNYVPEGLPTCKFCLYWQHQGPFLFFLRVLLFTLYLKDSVSNRHICRITFINLTFVKMK